MINTLTYQNQTNKQKLFFIILTITGILAIFGYYNITLTKTIDFPVSVPFDYATDDDITTTFDDDNILLFRGVHALHPDLPNAKIGIANPIGGHSDPELHNFGDNKSVFTSWTTNIWLANSFACRNGNGGVVLTKIFHRSKLTPSPDNFQQGEWLIAGIVTGAVPLPTFDMNLPFK